MADSRPDLTPGGVGNAGGRGGVGGPLVADALTRGVGGMPARPQLASAALPTASRRKNERRDCPVARPVGLDAVAGVEGIPQAIPHEIDAQNCEHNENAGEDPHPPHAARVHRR